MKNGALSKLSLLPSFSLALPRVLWRVEASEEWWNPQVCFFVIVFQNRVSLSYRVYSGHVGINQFTRSSWFKNESHDSDLRFIPLLWIEQVSIWFEAYDLTTMFAVASLVSVYQFWILLWSSQMAISKRSHWFGFVELQVVTYVVTRPGRELLFTVVSVEEKYKAKVSHPVFFLHCSHESFPILIVKICFVQMHLKFKITLHDEQCVARP